MSSYTQSPDPVARDGTATFTIVVTNNENFTDAKGKITLGVNLPSNVNFTGASAPAECAFDLNVTPKTLTCTRNGLAKLATWTVVFTGKGNAVGAVTTDASVVFNDTDTDPNDGNDSLTKNTTVISGADLTVQLLGIDAPGGLSGCPAACTAVAGSNISYTITAINNGPDPISTIKIIDNLPSTSDFTYASATGTGWNCTRSGTTLTCLYAGAAIGVGATAPAITLSGQIIKATAGTITNGASVSSNDSQTGDPVLGNNGPSQVIVSVSEGTNLRANKTMVSVTTGQTTLVTAGAVTLTLSATNTGTQSASGVMITDPVPAGFVIGTLPSGCTAASQTITCTAGTLAAGATSADFVIPLTAPGVAGTGTNTASVSRSTPVAGSNTDASVNYVVSSPFAHLTLAKTKSPNPVAAGATVTSTIKVTNSTSSTSPATGTVRVTDTLSAQETFQSTSSAAWTCAAAGSPQVVTCDHAIAGSLARGAQLPDLVILTTAGNFTGTLTNTACTGLSASSPHEPADNSTTGNCASAGVTSTTYDVVDLAISKTALPASPTHVTTGTSSFSYTLTVTNTGDEDAPTAVVTDVLNSWYSGSAGTTTGTAVITGAGTDESCTFGSTVSCTLKNLVKGAPRTITISVSRPVKDGTIANTATVSSPDAVDSNGTNNTASADVIIDPVADVAITSMASAPNPVKVGVQLTYTTSIKNNGPSTAAGVVLRHVIVPFGTPAARMSYVSGSAGIAGTSATCGWTTFAGGDEAGAQGIECTGFNLTDGEARQLIFKVIPVYPYPDAQPANFVSTARISTTTDESSTANNTGSNTVVVDSKSIDLAVTDADSGYDPSSFGDSIVYQIVTQNNGPSQATGVKLSVTPAVPVQGSAAAPYTMNWNSAGSTLPAGATCSQPGGALTAVICYLGASQNSSVLAANGNTTFSLKFDTGPASNAPAGSLTFKTTAVVESFETGSAPFAGDNLAANNTVSETTTVLPKTDLAVVSKSVSAGSPFSINQPFTYTVVVANLGPSPATGVTVTDVLPAGLQTTAAPTAALGTGTLAVNNCAASGSPVTVTCTLGTLPVASSTSDTPNLVTITIPVKAPRPSYSGPFLTNITNTASIAPLPNTSRDPNPANDTNSVVVQISKSSIAGSVYSDNNRNAAMDGGEKITTAVEFKLYGKDQWDNDIGTSAVPITVSSSNGDFLFDNLPPAKAGTGYTLVETQPSGYYQSREYLIPGDAGGTTGTDNMVTGIVLPANTAATGYIFEEYRQATVSGHVYSDLNNDGQRSSGTETDITGVKVKISGTTYKNVDLCTVIPCEQNTSSGGYSFNVPPSAVGQSYTITEESQPSGYFDGRDQNGSGAGNVINASAGRTHPEAIVIGQVDPNTSFTERNFGELAAASISGTVFIDVNADAVKQAGENGGVPGVGITLSGNDHLGNSVCNTVTCSITTDSSGNYSFTGLPPSGAGGYTVTEAAPSGLTHTGAQAGSLGGTINGTSRAAGTGVTGATATSAIVPGAGVSATNYNFGAKGQGISGFVYADLNRNGVKDAGEPGISGVTITLSGTTVGNVSVCSAIAPNPCSVTTGADGGYNFAGLPQSNSTGYTLTETQPAGYPDGQESLGTVSGTGGANGAISGTGPVFDQFSGIVLPIDGVGTNYNFGEWAASIAGTVYVDVDGSNGNNAGDLPLAGITVALSGAKTATATTDASGNFKFTGLPAGTYTLTETQPVSYGEATNTAGTSGGTVSTVANTSSLISGIALVSGTDATGYLFGEKGGSLSGTVYHDANNNGTQDAGETTGIAGVTLTLTGTAADGTTAVNFTATTAANGGYSFAGLPKANATGYTVTQTQPGAYLDGKQRKGLIDAADCTACDIATANVITKIPLDPAKTFTRYDFGEVLASSIAGRVFADADNDSTHDAGEEIAGVTLTLSGNDDRGAAVNTTATTAADGTYSFTGLRPSGAGGYTVTETQPSWIGNYTAAAGTLVGSIGGTATGTAALDVISGVALPSGASGINYNFRENASSIAGAVYLDSNNNGIKDAGEPGIADVTITLTGTTTGGAAVTRTQATAADGSYLFINLASGTYTLTETHPGAYSDGRETAGTSGGTVDNSGFDATPARNTIGAIGLVMGSAATGYNFGELPPPVAPTTASIAGRVYIDGNDNGLIDSGEAGIPGVAVTLSGTSKTGTPVSLTVQTANDGSYVFSGVPESDAAGYTIAETQPSAYGDGKTTKAAGNPGTPGSAKPVASGAQDIITKVTVAGGNSLIDYNFGEQPSGTAISGYVYVDANDNGVRDAGEKGIAGVPVRLTGTDASGKAVDLATTTAADGSYSFTRLQPSSSSGYVIAETQPAAYIDGKTTIQSGNPGVVSATKPVAAGGNDLIASVVVAAGAGLTNYNFGEKASTSIAGNVYIDANDNGIREAGETGIAGVSVNLTGTDSEGKSVSRTTTTAADGSYLFANLAPSGAGGYVITESQPAKYADGKTTIAAGNPGRITAAKPVASGSADTIAAVVIANGAVLTDYNFGEKEIGNSIAGFVYADRNDNGVRDADEPGIANVTVTLTGIDASGKAVNRSLQTGEDGNFLFDRLPASGPAGYALTETQPPRFQDGKTTLAAGNPGRADSVKPATSGNIDRISAIVLTNGSALSGYLFGEIPVPTLKPPIVNGYVWLDRAHNRERPLDGSHQGAAGWTVQLRRNGATICTTQTGGNGFYQFDNLHCPGYEFSGLPTGSGFSIVFTKEGSNLPAVPVSGGGRGQVPPTGGQITNITLNPNDEVVEQNLPLDPAGVVYDSLTRQPIKGAVVTIFGPPGFNPATHLVGSSAAQVQSVGDDGLYQFLLQNDFPTGVYTLTVAAPAGYLPAPSTRLPACNGAPVVGLFPDPALVQASDTAPAQSVTMQLDPANCAGMVPGGARTTQYYFGFHITNGGSAPILNNHIPLDAVTTGSLVVSKTTPMVNVARGDLVPYTVTVTNVDQRAFTGVGMRDQMPPGFKYRSGSARRDGVPVEPVVNGRLLSWPGESYAPQEKHTYTLVLAVGAGVGDGDYVNQAYAIGGNGAQASNTGTATVRIVPDPTFDCPDVIGKVFDDRNANGYQDDGEPGIPAVRVVTPRGLLVTTDAEGRFHVPCAEIPNADRGSNFVMKLDERTLPSGYRVTTENPRDVRVTRGKMVKLNFGATIHRVVRIELSDKAFEAGAAALRAEWNKQMDSMMEQLKTRPSVVRIAYRRGGEDNALVRKRLDALDDGIRRRWKAIGGMYTLAIETEDAQ